MKDQGFAARARSCGWLTVLAAAGFTLTGVLFYPYGITRDSQASFVAIYCGFTGNESWVGINNWMGWFVPAVWGWLRSGTGLDSAIGLVHNLLYWVSMPLIYRNLFPGPSDGRLFSGYNGWFVAFAFYPPLLLMLTSITNNVLLLSLVAAALAVISFYPKRRSGWLLIGAAGILVVATLVRRDAILFAAPFIAGMTFLSAQRAKISVALFAVAIFFALSFGINKAATAGIPGYADGIRNTEYISLFDLVGMSHLKQEVLIPEDLLKEKYRGAGRGVLLGEINAIPEIHQDHYFYHGFEPTEQPYWHCGLTPNKSLPVYAASWREYLAFRAAFTWRFFTWTGSFAQNAYFYQDLLEIMGVEAFPNLGPLVMKIQLARMKVDEVMARFLPFVLQLWFYLLLSIVSLCLLLKGNLAVPAEVRDFLLLLLGVIWIAVALLCVANVVIQLRYPFAYAFFVWPVFVYLVRTRLRNGSAQTREDYS
jgi:hypothetical protein